MPQTANKPGVLEKILALEIVQDDLLDRLVKLETQMAGSDPDTPRFAHLFKDLGELKEIVRSHNDRMDARWGEPKRKCPKCEKIVGKYAAVCPSCDSAI